MKLDCPKKIRIKKEEIYNRLVIKTINLKYIIHGHLVVTFRIYNYSPYILIKRKVDQRIKIIPNMKYY